MDGSINDATFKVTLQPDGRGSHWMKVTKNLREAAEAEVGDRVTLAITPVAEEPEPKVPADLKKALTNTPKAKAMWLDITPVARRDWIQWIVSAKKPETRDRRIATATDMLASGKRRVCCFDRSGIYSKTLAAPRSSNS